MSSKIVQALKSLSREGITRLSEATTRFDDWQNRVTGFGTSIDKTTYTQYVGSIRLSDQVLSNLYHGDDLAARMIDIVPDELVREGFALELGDAGLNAEVSDQFDALGIDGKLADAVRWGRLYGGAALLLGADDGRSAMAPLVPERAKSLAFVHVLDRRYLWPLTYYTDPTNPKVGTPETYTVATSSSHIQGQGVAAVHESRLVLFGGATTGTLEREQNNSWDHSVLQRAVQPLAAFNTGWKAVELLLTDANQAVFKVNGLSEMLGAAGEETLKARMQVVDLFRSVMRAIVVDAGAPAENINAEDFTRQTVSFSDIPATLDKFMLRLAAAVQIPVTILMGQSPAGMNATGDSDFRWFYDRIRSEQNRKLAPKIRRITKVMLATKAFNNTPKVVTVKFAPLWTEPPLAQATTRKMLLDGDAVATVNGFLTPAEVSKKRFGDANGFEGEIVLSPEGIAARDAELKGDLEDLSKQAAEPPPDDGGGFGGGAPFRGDGSEDQPREPNGQFASTDGGGSSGGGAANGGRSDRASVARERLQSAKASHEQAKAAADKANVEHESAKNAALAGAQQRIDEMKAAASEAKGFAEEAKAKSEQAKADKQAAKRELAKATKEHQKKIEALEKEHDAAHEAADAAADAETDPAYEAFHAENDAATSPEEKQAASDKLDAVTKAANDRADAAKAVATESYEKQLAELDAAHEAASATLEARIEARDEEASNLKYHAKALSKEARALDKQTARAAQAKAAIEKGDIDRAESLSAETAEPDRDASASYVAEQMHGSSFPPEASAEQHEKLIGQFQETKLAAEAARAPKSQIDLDSLAEATASKATADKKLARTERAVRVHEREIARLSK